MNSALKELLGTHDFSAFQRSGSNRLNAYTTIQEVCLERSGDLIIIEIQAKGFLYGMVRLLVGQLVALGEQRLGYEDFQQRWKKRRRCEVKEAAPANGLCLLGVGYKNFPSAERFFSGSQPQFLLGETNTPSHR